MRANRFEVEVAHAKPERQLILPVEVEEGATVGDAIERSGILDEFPEIDLGLNKVGIFGKVAKLDATLSAGDRVEIYRALIADPKESRKRRAAETRSKKN